MWFFRGAQSAVFFYMTCTPCAEHLDRQKRKRCAARGFRDPIPLTDGTAADPAHPQQPIFHQPFPFSTNVFWEEEITLGPGPPARRKNGKANMQRSLDKHKQQQKQGYYQMVGPSSYGSQSKYGKSKKGKGKGNGKEGNGNGGGGGDQGVNTNNNNINNNNNNNDDDNNGQLSNERWNWKRYQREDEVLWGKEREAKQQKRSKTSNNNKSASLDDHDNNDNDEIGPTYFIARNPEVNDLHPPVVSGPKTRSDTRWMLQPPPCANVMAGKVRLDQDETSGRVSRQTSAQVKCSARKPALQSTGNLLRASPSEKAQVLRMMNINENVAPGDKTENQKQTQTQKQTQQQQQQQSQKEHQLHLQQQEQKVTSSSSSSPSQETNDSTPDAPFSSKPTQAATPLTSSPSFQENTNTFTLPPITLQRTKSSASAKCHQQQQQLTLDIPSSDEDFSDADDATFSAATLSPIEASPTLSHNATAPFPSFLSSPVLDDNDRHRTSREFLDHLGSFDSFNARSNAPTSASSRAAAAAAAAASPSSPRQQQQQQQFTTKSYHAYKTSSGNGSIDERKWTADSGKAFPMMMMNNNSHAEHPSSRELFFAAPQSQPQPQPPLTGNTAATSGTMTGTTVGRGQGQKLDSGNGMEGEGFAGFRFEMGHMASQKTVVENEYLAVMPKQLNAGAGVGQGKGPLELDFDESTRHMRWSMDI